MIGLIFLGQAGPREVDVSRLDGIGVDHSRDGLGLCPPGAPFGNFWLLLGYRFGYR